MLDSKVPGREILNVTGQHVLATLNHYDHQKMHRRVEIADAINNMQTMNPSSSGNVSATVTSGAYEEEKSQAESISNFHGNAAVTLGELNFSIIYNLDCNFRS